MVLAAGQPWGQMTDTVEQISRLLHEAGLWKSPA
jgi:hypothetical protein